MGLLWQLLAISVGASLGAAFRWALGITFNGFFPAIPPGTWLANVIGGYLIGLAMTFFGQHPELSPEWRLFIITGFLGGLTTFSTFSAEVTALLQHGKTLWATTAVLTHVAGSLLATLLGVASFAFLKSS